MFPLTRLRRLRYNAVLRDMVQETRLHRTDFIMPVFVRYGSKIQHEIQSMPGIYQWSTDKVVDECKRLWDIGVQSIVLFGIPEHKDETGACACSEHGIVQQATRAIKQALPHMFVIADVCNCEYTTHGHCGTIVNGDVQNDMTIHTLSQQSVSLAQAGIDMVAPSDMMDGRVLAIRTALDGAGFEELPILSYSVKYASAFYGPFRDAAESAPQFGDRKTYQMNPANSREALREIETDIAEGADMVMVKPALSYLDIIQSVKQSCNVPVVAYNVSGEYAMVKAAAQRGWIDEQRIVSEILTSIKRAGADSIISYHTQDIVGALNS
ncbi:MAG: Delta-aminolevulinic acid dehydratase [Bacteroidetes bacterium ADurb.Bin217]|nr:MAG: Delta-aminolevulinic acid dehydratase [Bacteroidetes bacterium ADurb.Bin217]